MDTTSMDTMDTTTSDLASPLPAQPSGVLDDHAPEGQAPEDIEPEDLEPEKTKIFRQTLKDFREELLPSRVDEFSKATLVHVKHRIIGIQTKQEAKKEMMNLSRLRSFLEQFSNFDNLCKEAKVWGDQTTRLLSWIWGPSIWILKTVSEHPKVLESILDGYRKLGKHVPATQNYRELVLTKPMVAESLAYMYHDLLIFHKRIVGLLHHKGWQKTFESSWKDYNGEFQNLLVKFKAHADLLGLLFSTWQRQCADELMGRSQNDHTSIQTIERRLNDFVLQFQDASQDSGSYASQHKTMLQRIEKVMNDIRQHVNDHTIQAADSQHVLDTLVSTFNQLRINMTCQFDNLERNRKAEMKRHVLSLMSNPGNPQVDHHESIRDARTPGTGEWLLDDSVVWSWLHESPPSDCLVWLRGRMGAGKTVLTSLIIEECRKKKEEEGFHTSYFYCRGDDVQQNTSLAVLMDILRQMAQHNDDLIAYCNDKSIEGPLGSINVVKQLLEAFCEYDTDQFVVIDGLDECEEGQRKIIIDFWKAMVDKTEKQKPGKLRVFLVSQDKADIEASLKSSAEARLVYVHPAYTDEDIKRYVLKSSSSIQEKFQLGPDRKRVLEKLICERAKGMFLYAYLTIENLLQQPNDEFFRSELEQTLPQGLPDAYNKTIERLKNSRTRNNWTVTRKILIWLAGATRPLKETELAAALAVDLSCHGTVSFKYHERKLREDIRVLCGSLVRVAKCEDEPRIEFAHSSTGRYLRDHMEQEGLGQKDIEFDLASKCLGYLSLRCFQPGLSADELAKYARNGYYALQDYASAKLRHHIQKLIQHTAPMFGQHSLKATENTTKLCMVLRRFLSFYGDIKPLSEGALLVESAMSSRGVSPMAVSETPPSSWGSAGDLYSQDGLFVTPASTERSSMSPFPSSAAGRPTAPDPNGDPVVFCGPFREVPDLHGRLAQLWTHLYEHARLVDPGERERVAGRQLRAAVQAGRAAVQALGGPESAPADRETARALYGGRLYKCERTACSFFFEGFATAAERDEHARRHEKPYRCKVADCSLARFGFSNKKDRDKHVRTYHTDKKDGEGSAAAAAGGADGRPPEDGDDDDDDDDDGDGDPGSSRRPTHHICPACNKRFTRKANLDSHVDTHNGVRRHSCEACGKAFTRVSDLRRHKKLHERRIRGR